MRHGFLRSLSGLLSGTAFAVAVAGPIQLDPCPMHGVGAVHAAAAEMPAGGAMPMAPSAHGSAHGHRGADHQCTCPGGCCGSAPVGLNIARFAPFTASIALAFEAEPLPGASVSPRARDQLRLPPAHAPPFGRDSSQGAAHHLT